MCVCLCVCAQCKCGTSLPVNRSSSVATTHRGVLLVSPSRTHRACCPWDSESLGAEDRGHQGLGVEGDSAAEPDPAPSRPHTKAMRPRLCHYTGAEEGSQARAQLGSPLASSLAPHEPFSGCLGVPGKYQRRVRAARSLLSLHSPPAPSSADGADRSFTLQRTREITLLSSLM